MYVFNNFNMKKLLKTLITNITFVYKFHKMSVLIINFSIFVPSMNKTCKPDAF